MPFRPNLRIGHQLAVLLFCWLLTFQVATGSAQQTLQTEALSQTDSRQLAVDVVQLGHPTRGAIAFFRPEMNCSKCHEPAVNGRRLGPELTQRREVSIEKLIDAVLHPSQEIHQGFETTVLLLADGRQVSGIVVSESADEITIDRIEELSQPLVVQKTEIDDRKLSTTSTMPDALANQLSDRQEFLDLICYLKVISVGGLPRAIQLRPVNALTALAPLPAYENQLDHRGMIESWNGKMFNQGREIFRLSCASCHGDLANEGSMPTSLRFAQGQFKRGSDPLSMYQTLTHGYGMMNAQRWMVPEQKYAVIHYIRETFLRDSNPTQYFTIDEDYLAGLPSGDTRGPRAIESSPWTAMDYGPSLIGTFGVSGDATNIAQKGIAIRLDDGPGGVESGNHWMMYDLDTLRVAGAWSGQFIDYNGVNFSGVHNQHPRVAGNIHLQNLEGPGWGRPSDGSFDDERLLGRDQRRYGPLDREWAQYRGLYRFGRQTILKFTVGTTEVLESPSLQYIAEQPTFVRTLNVGPREQELILQIANQPSKIKPIGDAMLLVGNGKQPTEKDVAVDDSPATDRRDSILASLSSDMGDEITKENWISDDIGSLRLRIPAGQQPVRLNISLTMLSDETSLEKIESELKKRPQLPGDLKPLLKGGPANWPAKVVTALQTGADTNGFAVDVLTYPTAGAGNCRLRMTGLDFLPGEDAMVICTWDGSVWKVSGIGQTEDGSQLTWRRIAAGLFQPLGIKIRDGVIFVSCRDQIVALHDLNSDGEMDWYECFNNDHQVTEHFHEFAMGLQTDREGNFYYAKSARHALPALVPHHGTLLKVSADGQKTEIIANGFRAANGICLNPDGSFVVTDQEGHWNPKNRINWVTDGGFFGNMMGFHDVTDPSDSAMKPPLCWITNSFDRSPAELLWVDSDKWGPLNGSLLNFSYGYGKVYVVPHESVDGKMQGGMCAFDLPQFPTGVMRGRFRPEDGQLYCCGMFAWSGTQEQPGGLYRMRYCGGPVNLPIGLHALKTGIEIEFSDPISKAAARDKSNYAIKVWGLKRSANYGSEHFDEQQVEIESATLDSDGRTVKLAIPNINPTWCMEIVFALQSETGQPFQGKIHNTIHVLRDPDINEPSK